METATKGTNINTQEYIRKYTKEQNKALKNKKGKQWWLRERDDAECYLHALKENRNTLVYQ